MITEFPKPLATVIGEVVGEHYYHHQTIETLFYESGASGEVPEGSCVKKVIGWLIREGKDDSDNSFLILGKVLEEFMDGDIPRNTMDHEKGKERVEKALARFGLRYSFGGKIYGAAVTAPSKSLNEKLKELSISEIEIEFERAHQSIDQDPPAALTAACAIIESFCKVYISENKLTPPNKQTIKELWRTVSNDLNLSPTSIEDDDLKRILSGLISITDGIGALRTHAGSAHGQGKKSYKISPRHARLAVHAAHTLCLFGLETWETRREKS